MQLVKVVGRDLKLPKVKVQNQPNQMYLRRIPKLRSLTAVIAFFLMMVPKTLVTSPLALAKWKGVFSGDCQNWNETLLPKTTSALTVVRVVHQNNPT